MKKLLSLLSLLLFVSLAFTSCKKKEVLTAEDLTYNYRGCPTFTDERAMGKVNATTTKGNLTYSFVSQSLGSVLAINPNTGEIAYYQVAWQMTLEKTIDREFAALEKIRDNHPKFLLTTDGFTQSRNGIKHINVFHWLLNTF